MNKRNPIARVLAAPLRLAARIFRKPPGRARDVYFISGMCYNCSVFNRLALPKGWRRHYIEWYVPREEESLQEYARTMARAIDTGRPFVLVGYSFGAVVMQEMNRFLAPEKNIVISSFKNEKEIPRLFKAVKLTHAARRMPDMFYESTDFITGAFNRLMLNTTNREVEGIMTQTHPAYIRWAVERITEWTPDIPARNLFHIHGTADEIFPYEKIQGAIPVEGGDHLMVWKRADEVSALLGEILLSE